MPDDNTGLILHLQRLSTEDGPGIRTTIFFKGCPLHCLWCHNPESIAPYPQVQWIETRCIGCELCLAACPNGALSRLPEGMILVDREKCQGCGQCAAACPSTALEILGKRESLDDLMVELLKDRAYFEASGGGVTASGGEPMLQSTFVTKLFTLLQAEGVHTALDTCGACSPKSIDAVLPVTNLVLFDLKLMDTAEHQRLTGMGNEVILKNLNWISSRIRNEKLPTRLWIRTPLIPGVSTGDEHLAAIGRYLDQNLNGLVERWELCAFNNLCRDKYRRLGMAWHFEETPLMPQTRLDRCEQAAKTSSFDPERILVTGAASSA